MIWRPNSNGAFPVRSAYEVSLRVAARAIPSSSRSYPILAEVRVQAWRLCYEAVPTMDNLSCKHGGIETKCVFCEAEVETTKHVLLKCPFAHMVWALSHIPWGVVNGWTWALWRNRNQRRMEGVVWEPPRVVNDALLLLTQYQEARIKELSAEGLELLIVLRLSD
ncbi:hypothetical protein Salat_2918500 [Sesamum alatum]|uniref:Reverse transcriptase zinc-binding domain-containing protein n=1 Tax=Sesamum alatum TaxID=300844 RepID=A0AAE2C8B2_9LAMI|nr:hypothetical protein Salat_2918500 [Sesamum alatum]